MSSFRMISIPGFDNPVTRRPGGAEFQTGQILPIKQGISCIAIAPDSHVDVVDILIDGDGAEGSTRIRVSVGAPFYGEIAPRDVDNLVIVPVRAFDAPTAGPLIDQLGPAEFPRLKLAVYGGCMPPLTGERAPAVDSWSGVGGDPVYFYAPTAGRRRVAITIRGALGLGSSTLEFQIFGNDALADDDGTIVAIPTALVPSTDAIGSGVGVTYEYVGTPFGIMGVVMFADAGAWTYDVMIETYDH